VIDLSKIYAVDYKHSFTESENLLEVVLTRGALLEKIVNVSVQEQKQAPVATNDALPVTDEKAVVSPVVDEKPLPVPVAATEDVKDVPPVVTKENAAPVVEEVPSGVPQLLEVSFDDSSNRGEMVLFHLNDFFPPTVSAIEKNNPRVLCDFPGMKLSSDVQKQIDAGGKYVESVRTAYHADKDMVRVVLDLSPDRDYDLQQVFFKNDNLFVLIVNELPSEKDAQ
jgi:hypothetical protein